MTETGVSFLCSSVDLLSLDLTSVSDSDTAETSSQKGGREGGGRGTLRGFGTHKEISNN